MRIDWKSCFKIGVSIFVLYLAIHYWDSAAGLGKALLAAASPIVFGCVFAYLVNILMRIYERWYFPKTQSAVLRKSRRPVCLIAAFLTIVLVMVLIVLPQLASCAAIVANALPDAMDEVVSYLDASELITEDTMAELSAIDWEARLQQIGEQFAFGVGSVVSAVGSAATTLIGAVTTLVIGIFFSIYLLVDKERVGKQFQRLFRRYLPTPVYDKTAHVLGVMNETMRNFIVGQCTDALILGVLCSIGMWLLGLPYATVVGPLIAFTALIPVIGPLLGGCIGAFLILLESPKQALIFIIFLLALQLVEENLIYPRVVGNSVGLPGIWVLAVVIVGGAMFGVLGMLLGVPLAAAVYKLVREDVKKGESEQDAMAK